MMLMGLSYGLGVKQRICRLLEATARQVLENNRANNNSL